MRQAPRAAAGDGTGAWHQAAASLPGPAIGRPSRLPITGTTSGAGRCTTRSSSELSPMRCLRLALTCGNSYDSWGHAELDQDASVVISELVSNAVVASAELRPAVAPVLIWLGSDGHHVLVAVADASPQPPVRLNPGPDAERGRGLALVEALSSRWGWHLASITGLRKLTWAEWHLPPGPASGQLPACQIPVPVEPPRPPCRGGDHAGITRA